MANVPDGSVLGGWDRYETFDAERVNLYVQAAISEAGFPGLADAAKLRAFRQVHIDNMVYQLTSWCVAGRVPSNQETKVIEWPDGVWQMFKARWMPEWFTQRFPVKHIRREIATVTNHYFVCPHLVTDPQQQHVRFMMTAKDSKGRKW